MCVTIGALNHAFRILFPYFARILFVLYARTFVDYAAVWSSPLVSPLASHVFASWDTCREWVTHVGHARMGHARAQRTM
jgi:hypothetical protein